MLANPVRRNCGRRSEKTSGTYSLAAKLQAKMKSKKSPNRVVRVGTRRKTRLPQNKNTPDVPMDHCLKPNIQVPASASGRANRSVSQSAWNNQAAPQMLK